MDSQCSGICGVFCPPAFSHGIKCFLVGQSSSLPDRKVQKLQKQRVAKQTEAVRGHRGNWSQAPSLMAKIKVTANAAAGARASKQMEKSQLLAVT